MIDSPSPAVLEAAHDCRDAMGDDLTNREILDVIAVLLADLVHYTAKTTEPSEQLRYALSVLQVRAPALLASSHGVDCSTCCDSCDGKR
jgi:hypothetical protein